MSQSTHSILMVRPANFGFNPQTAESNPFQSLDSDLNRDEIVERAKIEFDSFTSTLDANGVNVTVVEDNPHLKNTDAVFPNNWISFHEGGEINIYPMFAQIRRKEKENGVLEAISKDFQVLDIKDYSSFEEEDRFMEGTGSMVLDRANKIAYACLSNRTDKSLFESIAENMGYEAISFASEDQNRIPLYHTNVMMSIGSNFAVICLESIRSKEESEKVISRLESTNHRIVDISFSQMASFAGNLLEVKSQSGETLIVLSESAYQSLDATQLSELENHGRLVPISIPTIENAGGGSVRCMMAEVFLSPLNS